MDNERNESADQGKPEEQQPKSWAEEESPAEETQEQAPPKQEDSEEESDKFLEFTKKATNSAEKAIGTSYKKAKEAFQKSGFESRLLVRRLDDLLNWARERFPAEKFDVISAWFAKYGHAGLVAAEILIVVFYLIAGIKFSNGAFILKGIAFALLLVILQYTADRFLNAGKSLVESSPSKMKSAAFLDCTALLSEIFGLLVFLAFLIAAKRQGNWGALWVGLGAWALLDAIAFLALHPSLVNISIDEDARAGEEAIGIMSFGVKAVVRIVPIAFGVGAILGSIGLLFCTLALFGNHSAMPGRHILNFIIFCACLPLFSYVFFVFYHLIIDLMRAILILPKTLNREE